MQMESNFNLNDPSEQLDKPLNTQYHISQEIDSSNHDILTQNLYPSGLEEPGSRYLKKQNLLHSDKINPKVHSQLLYQASKEQGKHEDVCSKHCDQSQYLQEYQIYQIQNNSSQITLTRSQNNQKKFSLKQMRSEHQLFEAIYQQIVFTQFIIYQIVEMFDTQLDLKQVKQFCKKTQNSYAFIYQNVHLLVEVIFGNNKFIEQAKTNKLVIQHPLNNKIIQYLFAKIRVELNMEAKLQEFKRLVQYLKEQQ
ncbi:unnamed protein product [Paramecium octaurelia]|uniref:Uncharacterized protein n=1 Tax=Paramecium octaurelia TaxID=43137 RepID=A0A8S1XV99_PAROT|nr:unnamed protein product [Paramecium octaurelia]